MSGFVVTSCGGSGGTSGSSGTGGGPTQKAIQQQSASKAISSAASKLFNPSNVAASMNSIAAAAKLQANVSTAVANANSVLVTYKSGEKEIWCAQENFDVPAMAKPGAHPTFVTRRQSKHASTWTPGRSRFGRPVSPIAPKTALTINFATNDTLHGDVATPLKQVRDCLATAGYRGKAAAAPDSWGHDDFTLGSVAKLSGYGVVILITHGYQDATTATQILTGEVVTAANRTKYAKWWAKGYVMPGTVLTKSPGDSSVNLETDWCFNKDFLTSDFFDVNGLPHPLDFSGMVMFDGACDQMVTMDLAQQFLDLGASAFYGYDGEDTFSPWSFEALAEALEGGGDTQTVLTQPWAPVIIEDPVTGSIIHGLGHPVQLSHLAHAPTITITSPSQGAFIPPNSNLQVTGHISGYTIVNQGPMFPWAWLYFAGSKMTVSSTGDYLISIPVGPTPGPTTLVTMIMGNQGFAATAIDVGNGN